MTPRREITDAAYRKCEKRMQAANMRSLKDLLGIYADLVAKSARADWHWQIASFKRRYEQEHEQLPYNPNYVVQLLDLYKKDVLDSGVPISILVIGHDLPDLAEIIAAEANITAKRMRAYAHAFRKGIGPYGTGKQPDIDQIEKDIDREAPPKPPVVNLPSIKAMIQTLNAYQGYLGMAEYEKFFASRKDARNAVRALQRTVSLMMQEEAEDEQAATA